MNITLNEELNRMRVLMGCNLLKENSNVLDILIETSVGRTFRKIWDDFVSTAGKDVKLPSANKIAKFADTDISSFKLLKSHFDDGDNMSIWKLIVPTKYHSNINLTKTILKDLSDSSNKGESVSRLFKKNAEGDYLFEKIPTAGGIRGEILYRAQKEFPTEFEAGLKKLPSKEGVTNIPNAEIPKVSEPDVVTTPENKITSDNLPFNKREKPNAVGFTKQYEDLPEDVSAKYNEINAKTEKTKAEQDFLDGYKKWKDGEDVDWEDLKSKIQDETDKLKNDLEFMKFQPKWYNDGFMWKFWVNQMVPYYQWLFDPLIRIFKNAITKMGLIKPKTFEEALFELNKSFTKGLDATVTKKIDKIGGNAYFRDFIKKFQEMPRFSPDEMLKTDDIYGEMWDYFIEQYPKYIKGDKKLMEQFDLFTAKLLSFQNVTTGVKKGYAMKDFLETANKNLRGKYSEYFDAAERQLTKVELKMIKAFNNIPYVPDISENSFRNVWAAAVSFVRGGSFTTPKNYEKYLLKQYLDGSLKGIDYGNASAKYVTPKGFKSSQLFKWLMIRYAISNVLVPVVLGFIQAVINGTMASWFNIKTEYEEEPIFEDAEGGQRIINYFVAKILEDKKVPWTNLELEGWQKYASLLPGYTEEIPIMLGKLAYAGIFGGDYTWSQREAIEWNKKLAILPVEQQRLSLNAEEWLPGLKDKLRGRNDIITDKNGQPYSITDKELKLLRLGYDITDTKNLKSVAQWVKNERVIRQFKYVQDPEDETKGSYFYRKVAYDGNKAKYGQWIKL
jgi:hypothetical protein